MKKIAVLFISLIFIQCGSNPAPVRKSLQGPIAYSSVNIPEFFQTVQLHYFSDLFAIHSTEYNEFCDLYELAEDEIQNRTTWVQIQFLHKLFTSSTAQNGSLGPILTIPYFWHWIKPNPRHSITDLRTGNFLTLKPTTPEFKNYKSYADIDRTPSLFLKELFATTSLYSHASCDSFSTFGWCSEREAAFACLMDLYGYQSKVIVKGNHSWSEHLVYFRSKSGKRICFETKTDNTFDIVTFSKINNPVLVQWHAQTGDPGLAKWHNNNAHSLKEKTSLKTFIVPEKSFKEIEEKVRAYIISQIVE